MNPAHHSAVLALLDAAKYPSGSLNESEAWLGFIQVLSWYDWGFLHVYDSSELNPERVGSKRAPRTDGPWQRRAAEAEAFLARTLGVTVEEVRELIGLMWKHDLWVECESPNQKANPVGNGLRYAVAYVLQRWGNEALDYREEQALSTYWPGIAIPGVQKPKADVLAVEHVGARPRALISCKWSMRTDRVSDAVRECGVVKATAHRMSGAIGFYIVCHEYGASRIERLLEDECVDALALVNLPVLEGLGLVTQRLQEERDRGRLLDLQGLIRATDGWAS